MADDFVLTRPGKKDINDQFTAGKNINRSRRLSDRISVKGDYNFGELTAFFFKYDEDQAESWRDDIKNHYTDQQIVDQIKQNVISVLLKVVDPRDPNTPISLRFEWDEAGGAGVTMTSDAAGHAHTMKISGFKEPKATAAETRKK